MDLSNLLELVNKPTLRPFTTQDVASIKATFQAEIRESLEAEDRWSDGAESIRQSARQRARASLLDRCAWATGGNLDVLARAGLLLAGLGLAGVLLVSQVIESPTWRGLVVATLGCVAALGGGMLLGACFESYRREARLRTEGLRDLIDEWEVEAHATATPVPASADARTGVPLEG